MGIVAENKKLSSDMIEASPIQDLPLLDKEITDDAKESIQPSQNADGVSAQNKSYASITVPAKWLPIAGGNRHTPPDVRRGAVVMLYQVGDEKRYYWTTLTNDHHLRKLETVLYVFSATQEENAPVNGDNYYYLEVSTHTKCVTFHTSKADGEPFTYDIQINTKEGKIVITDDINNYILLDSKEKQLRLENADGCFLEIKAKNGHFNIVDNLLVDVGQNMTTNVGQTNTVNASNHQFTGPINSRDPITAPLFIGDLQGTAAVATVCLDH